MKWTLQSVKKFAADFSTKSSFREAYPDAYYAALHSGWIEEVCAHAAFAWQCEIHP